MVDAETDRREGRGRLSSIDMLPDDADPEIQWAVEQLRERTMPQTAILAEFNARLADRGVASVSKSSFSRWAVRKAIQLRRLDETRRITSEIVSGLGTDGADEVTVAVAELLKVAIFEQLEKGERDPKSIMEMSRALQSVVGAQKTSTEHRRRLEERVSAQMEVAADKVEKLATEGGMSAERAAQIRRDVLGLRI